MGGAGFLGGDATNHLGAVVEGLLGLEGTLVACHSLADDLGFLIYPDSGSGTK